ncbi:MAG: hypothetical protein IK038_07350 [Bacteroidaceae bacterium]|nr:hypothetical protein [Bacteroidaceae bacterium]MBR4793464.1 hypothetical protein [Bacteroidaceae bacterium]
MKDWEDIIKERQLSRKAELPESDWNDFLSKREAHERAAKKRHRILAAAISIPAAAAVLLLLLLVPFNTDVPDNQVSQNEPSEQPAIADSVDVNPVDSVTVPADPEPEKPVPVIKAPKPVKRIFAQDKQQEPEPETVETPGEPQINQMLAEVAVSAVVAKVQMLNDTTMFNSAAFKLPDGESVEELVRKLPGVEIADDGSITVNGKPVSRILVNGKEFFSDNKIKNEEDEKTQELTQLTAEMIEKVKAYEKNSDLSRQTGYDDGVEELPFYLCVPCPMIVLNGQIADIDNSRLAKWDFWGKVRKRDMARLLGIPARKIKSVKVYDAESGQKIWGEKGAYGVISVVAKQ